MLNRIRRWFVHPVFEDEERTRTAQFMTSFSWIALSVLLVLIPVRLLLKTDKSPTPLLLIFGLTIVILIVQVALRWGYIKPASYFIVYSAWAIITALAWYADGLRDVAILGYLIVILLASFLLGWRNFFIAAGLSLISIWAFAFADQSNPQTPYHANPFGFAADLSGVFILICALIYLLISGWQRTLKAARVELTERLRAEEKLQKQTDYLTALHNTALGLLNRNELMPLLDSILVQACAMLETKHGSIDFILPDQVTIKQEHGIGAYEPFNGSYLQKGAGITGTVCETGQSLLINNYQTWKKSQPAYIRGGFMAMLVVPLKVNETTIGTLGFSYLDEKRKFTPQQVVFMEKFAALASLAIHSAKLDEQTQAEIRERRNIETALRASEERFRKVFQASPIAICITTLKDDRLLDANHAYWMLSGFDRETALGQTLETLDAWSDLEEHQGFIERIKIQHSIYDPDYQFTTSTNERKSAIALYELIEVNGQACVLSMFHDVTAQREAEQALRENEARMSAIFSALPDMILEIDQNCTLTGFIPSSEIQPLMPPEDFLGHNIRDLFPVSISLQTMFAVERALAAQQLHAFEYGMPPGEEVQFFEARVVPISATTVMMMVRDISQRKWVETDRENLIRELENKNAELERFTYTVSHDLKSPLITIRGFLGFLEQDAASGNKARLQNDVKRISDATEKMQTLLNELLELSRVGRVVNVLEYIAFEEIVNEALELVHGRLQSVKAKVQIQPDLPTVYGDRKRLVEVVQNIVDNAAKFMGATPNPLIEIGHEGALEGKPIFFIRDNGIGIEAKHLDRIFGLFNKLDSETEGTGIGLTIVKRIIEVHNGQIWVTSEAQKGSTFFFTLQTGPASQFVI
ncbi:MAG: PAS domain S-box protein [Anaerolineales bacterium]|nr:PAS domain S-box protein [Anaerolineales bacterium]